MQLGVRHIEKGSVGTLILSSHETTRFRLYLAVYRRLAF